ncbi:MAG: ATP-binding protein [Clostridia bacterium]|nr:ATP-binding protein [Clostridia bacterium]
MFKSIQWKVLTIFIFLVVSVMVVVGTFLLDRISDYYHDEFRTQMEEAVFTDGFVNQLSNAAKEAAPLTDLRTILDAHAGRMGIDSYRSYYILNGQNGELLFALDGSTHVEATQNLMTAMTGRLGNAVDRRSAVMDYACPVGNNTYIIYISDSKEELYAIMENVFTIILWGLILGVALSIFLGLILSRTIIAPIASLKKRAEKIAAGDFDNKIAVRSRDEIGQLTVSFNTMAADLKRSLDDIVTEKNKVETILAYMTDGVMAFYRDGSVMHINPAAKEMLSPEEGENFDSLFARLEAGITINTLLYLEQEKAVEKNITIGERHIKAFFAKLTPRRGPADGIVVVLQDITEQTRMEKSRREFVANVSHELRTPLTNIKSYAETLLETEEKDSIGHNFLQVINSEADRMTRIVRDLLTLSQLDYGHNLQKAPFPLPALVREVVRKQSMAAEKAKQTLTFTDHAAHLPPVNGDRDRIEQVLINIISNAMKYTPNGGSILVDCTARVSEAVITVTDTGIGIPKEDLPRIFERFYRVDKARSRKMGGTGLGLAIAREIVEAHGGRIIIESEKGKGTRVQIILPIYGGGDSA